MRIRRRIFFVGLALAAWVLVVAAAGPRDAHFTARLPMAITSCGQSPDAQTVSLLCTRMHLKHSLDIALTRERLRGIRTLVIVLGASAKGLDDARIDEKAEFTRVNGLLSAAKELGITVVAVHLGGESRRGPFSDKFIDLVVARAGYLIVTGEGNRDGLFTKVSKARAVPLVVVEQSDEVGRELKTLFVD
jgi:hypothetical protein